MAAPKLQFGRLAAAAEAVRLIPLSSDSNFGMRTIMACSSYWNMKNGHCAPQTVTIEILRTDEKVKLFIQINL